MVVITISDANIKLMRSPLSSRVALVSLKRAGRGGLVEAVEKRVEEMRYFDIPAYPCGASEFLYLPYFEAKPCAFREGNEPDTTREYARVNNHGSRELIVHPEYVFPGKPGWAIRVMDNKYPLTDKVDFVTNHAYDSHRLSDGFIEMMDARGKDYVIVSSPHHIVTANRIDFENIALLEQIFTKRELEDPDILYVCVGSNNAGLPRKILPPFMRDVHLDALIRYMAKLEEVASKNGGIPKEAEGIAEESKKTLDILLRNSNGYYESIGIISGASQAHVHKRVLSLPIHPPWIEEGYIRTEQKATTNGRASFYDYVKKEELLIEEGKYFALIADPVPEFSGGLLVIARDRQNIVEMDRAELAELGSLRKLGRVMHEILYGGLPSNDYMIQTFKEDCLKYPNTRFNLSLVPRKSVQAFLELGTKIVGLDGDSKELASTMRYLKERISHKIYQSGLENEV